VVSAPVHTVSHETVEITDDALSEPGEVSAGKLYHVSTSTSANNPGA